MKMRRHHETEKLQAKSKYSGTLQTGLTVEVRFKVTLNGEECYSDWVAVNSSTMEAGAAAALDSFRTIYGEQVADYVAGLQFTWQMRVDEDDDSIRDVSGSNTNPFYLTFDTPTGGTTLYHTVVHIGCDAAKGQSTEQTVFDAIWAKFVSKSIQAVKVQNGAVSGRGTLTYYGQDPVDPERDSKTSENSYRKSIFAEQIDGVKVASQSVSRAREWFRDNESANGPVGDGTNNDYLVMLLKSTDGTCNSWGRFMIFILGAQGLASTDKGLYNSSGIPPFKVNPEYEGQGNVQPKEFIFERHVGVEYNGIVYDPSYGVDYGACKDENNQPVDTYKLNFDKRLVSYGEIEEISPGFQNHTMIYIPEYTYSHEEEENS